MAEPKKKLTVTQVADTFIPKSNSYKVILTGDYEKDEFIVRANSAAEATTKCVGEYVRRNGVAPVTIDKVV